MTEMLLAGAAEAAAALVLLHAAAGDVLRRSVPNRASAIVACLGVALHLWRGDVLPGLAAATLVLLGTVLLWRLGLMGGADAKLIPAAATLLPAGQVPELLVCVAFSGGVLSAAYLALRHLPLLSWRRGSVLRRLRIEQRRARRVLALPYVVAICAGTLITLARG